MPVRDGQALFAKLMLDGMQAGLAWITILRKRETILEEFEGFAPEKLAQVGRAAHRKGADQSRHHPQPEKDPGHCRQCPRLSRHGRTGRGFLRLVLGICRWPALDGRLDRWKNAPAKTELSETVSKALKQRGFKFAGPVIVYAWMQAVGLVNDHETRCPRYREIRQTGA